MAQPTGDRDTEAGAGQLRKRDLELGNVLTVLGIKSSLHCQFQLLASVYSGRQQSPCYLCGTLSFARFQVPGSWLHCGSFMTVGCVWGMSQQMIDFYLCVCLCSSQVDKIRILKYQSKLASLYPWLKKLKRPQHMPEITDDN